MSRLKVCVLAAFVFGTLGNLWGSSPTIGSATAKGAFTVDKTPVARSSKFVDGARVETGAASSRLQLDNGSQIVLNANSSVVVHGSEALLEKGSGQFGASSGYSLQARTLRIETEGPGAKAEVRLTGERSVLVQAPLNGSVRVFSKTGVLVKLVDPGRSMTFDPYAGAADDFASSGCLIGQAQGPLFGLAVDNQLYQVAGPNLAGNVGNRVHIKGTLSPSAATLQGTTILISVTSIEMTDVGGCLAAAARFPGMTAQKPPEVPGWPGQPGSTAATSHKNAIIAGVSVAAVGGGIIVYEVTKSK